ncbi:flagellar protein [Sporolituus thermophilus]|uniref:Flagellar operon protein TIGR03826 n=1 Tax=Sporolituus thermophilus DSM 23256 TaxID=1123285 RepID=A0A1G7P1J5_9FIRM|nr:flagellar protein [Sporolituus thermophilus]SDF79489.1 hypothetical protein SAMN05660235_02782 [Sporolituus thermophilus DSM 23256]
MALKYCPDCGKLYVENAVGLCPACYAEQEQDELKVADYLREVKRASLEEIHQATGVRHKVILRMLRAGRIFAGAEVSYPCETCGEPITQGRLCAKCSRNFLEQLPPARKEAPEASQERSRMYTKDIFKRE